MSGVCSTGYNLAAEMTGLYTKYFDAQEEKLNGFIDKMATTNIDIKIISDVLNKLSHAKKEDKKADFSNDETMKRYIAYIHRNNPTIFEELVQGIPEQHLEPTPLSGDAITLENVLNQALQGVNLSGMKIESLTEEQIDVITQGLDSELKMYSADLNKHMMEVNKNYDERTQMTEAARQVMKQASDLLESINRKIGR